MVGSSPTEEGLLPYLVNLAIDQRHDRVIDLFGLLFALRDSQFSLHVLRSNLLIESLLVFKFAS